MAAHPASLMALNEATNGQACGHWHFLDTLWNISYLLGDCGSFQIASENWFLDEPPFKVTV